MISFLTNLPVYLLIIFVFIEKDFTPLFSFALLKFCIKEELLFRVIPFQYMEKNVQNCVIMGLLNGLYNCYVVNFGTFKLFVHCFIGIIYALASRKYDFFILVQLRYFLLVLM